MGGGGSTCDCKAGDGSISETEIPETGINRLTANNERTLSTTSEVDNLVSDIEEQSLRGS